MGHKFAEIAFTEQVKNVQREKNSRSGYEKMEQGEDFNFLLSKVEAEFIEARDSFYMASVSETGWPYVQHRGGPAGFMKVIDAKTIGFADYSGNRQYVSTGNFRTNDRVSIIFMDYPNKRRLKLLGRISLIEDDNLEMMAKLEDQNYRARVERAFIINIEAFDWNCPQHITPRFSEIELERLIEPLNQEINQLRNGVVEHGNSIVQTERRVLGDGALPLILTGIRQLTQKVRAFEFRDPDGKALPPVEAGSHLKIPFQMTDGEIDFRHYSICSNPERRDIYEIAVLKEEQGKGGSKKIYESLALGDRINCDLPENYFSLRAGSENIFLIAGGIGITPIKAMAQSLESQGREFEIHYLGKDKTQMAFADRLTRSFEHRINFYESLQNQKFSVRHFFQSLPKDSSVYICGPESLIDAMMSEAKRVNYPLAQLHYEKFIVSKLAGAKPVTVELKRSKLTLEVDSQSSILDAMLEAEVAIPYSCKTGECKSCQVKVLDGVVEHRDNALSEQEKKTLQLMCPCVSRGVTDKLVLDY